jgi:hypothetical protein
MRKLRHLVTATRDVLATQDLDLGILKPSAFERTVDNWFGGGDVRRPATTLLMVQVGRAGEERAERMDRAVVRDLTDSIRRLLRSTDILGAVDEDIVGVLLPSTPVDDGTQAAHRILKAYAADASGSQDGYALAIGVAGASHAEPWLEALRALRDARRGEPNTLIVASREDDEADRADE